MPVVRNRYSKLQNSISNFLGNKLTRQWTWLGADYCSSWPVAINNNLYENIIPQYYVMPAIVRPQWNLQIWSADCCVDGLDRHLCYPYGLIYVLCTNAHPLCTAISNIGMIQQLHLKIDLDFRIVHRWAPCYVPEFEERYVVQAVVCWGRHCGCVDARGKVLADWRVLSLCESHYRAAKGRKFNSDFKGGRHRDVYCETELNFAPRKLPICRSFEGKPEIWALEKEQKCSLTHNCINWTEMQTLEALAQGLFNCVLTSL